MKNFSRILSIYSSDTAGVCSMLYELGGLTVVHDASGCNSTYATHDEPRWYDMESMICISALTEKDAILGNDEKFIDDVVQTARTLHPAFIALCGSPMPYMTGTDFDALGEEIQLRTALPVFAMHTNGMNSYIQGASQALEKIVQYYAERPRGKSRVPSINILGATPLDFSINGQIRSMKEFFSENGFQIQCSMAMDCTLEEIRNCTQAHCNLVVSASGLAAARFLEKEYRIPYVCGVPVGKTFSRALLEALRKGETSYPCAALRSSLQAEKGVTGGIIHESIYASSLSCALALEGNPPSAVLFPLDAEKELLCPGDCFVRQETDCLEVFPRLKTLIADPMYKPIVPEFVRFHALPHEAYSGRCYRKGIRNLIAENFNIKEFSI